MHNQQTRKRTRAIFGIELYNRYEIAAVIGTIILFAIAAIMIGFVIS